MYWKIIWMSRRRLPWRIFIKFDVTCFLISLIHPQMIWSQMNANQNILLCLGAVYLDVFPYNLKRFSQQPKPFWLDNDVMPNLKKKYHTTIFIAFFFHVPTDNFMLHANSGAPAKLRCRHHARQRSLYCSHLYSSVCATFHCAAACCVEDSELIFSGWGMRKAEGIITLCAVAVHVCS